MTLNGLFKNKKHYEKILLANQEAYNKTYHCVELDKQNVDEFVGSSDETKDKVYNLVTRVIVTQRDIFSRNLKSSKKLVRGFIWLLSLRLVVEALIVVLIGLVYHFQGVQNPFQSSFSRAINITFSDVLKSVSKTFFVYFIVCAALMKKTEEESLTVTENDIKEYYDQKGIPVFGEDFRNALALNDDARLQIIANKETKQPISLSNTRALEFFDNKIVVPIGFLGTIVDSDLRYSIVNEMVDNHLAYCAFLKRKYPHEKVELELVTRKLDEDLLNFLVTYKGFRCVENVSKDRRIMTALDRWRYVL